MDKRFDWNLKEIFENSSKYEGAKKELRELLNEIKKYEGILGKSEKNVAKCYGLYEKALELDEKIYAYCMLTYHLNMADQVGIKLFKEAEKISTEFAISTAFIVPEITSFTDEKLKKYIASDELKRYKRILKEILEEKKHVLSREEENLLANYSEVFSSSENIFDVFTNAELKYEKIKDEKGKKVELTDSNYTLYLKSKDEGVRKQAFESMYKAYGSYINTIAEIYLSRVKASTITSRIRKYKSSLEQAVKNDDSSIKVYNALIEVVNEKLEVNHKFMELKKKLSGNKHMHLYDIYQNPIEKVKETVTYEESKKQVLEALSVLGDDYIDLLKGAFDNNWIDVYEKKNKRSGAYSLGVYGTPHPFVLTNFVGDSRDTSTIAHELGHAIHSYYSNSNQNILDSNYTIMVAEVASTVNEILLACYQIDHEKDMEKRNAIIYEMLEMIRATLYRQTMFAEFEKIVHEKIEEGVSLSSEDLCSIYYDLNKKYFGKDVIIDEQIKYEWARIPHFYSCFYVYKYATGISSAIAIASKILTGDKKYVEKYKNMLKLGCSKKSVELLKLVDVNLETKQPYEDAIKFFEKYMKKLGKNS